MRGIRPTSSLARDADPGLGLVQVGLHQIELAFHILAAEYLALTKGQAEALPVDRNAHLAGRDGLKCKLDPNLIILLFLVLLKHHVIIKDDSGRLLARALRNGDGIGCRTRLRRET